MTTIPPWFKVDWPAPSKIHAYVTTRAAGDLSYHANASLAGDTFKSNREHLASGLHCPPVVWLHQIHSNRVIDLSAGEGGEGDGTYITDGRYALAVLSADCLPILLCDTSGQEVAALHCGWRGLSLGIIEQGIKRFKAPADEILVWLGPAISAMHYEVDALVWNAFPEDQHDERCFEKNPRGHWQASLVQIAMAHLSRLGVTRIYGGHEGTYLSNGLYYSVRRESETGRFASLIWMT